MRKMFHVPGSKFGVVVFDDLSCVMCLCRVSYGSCTNCGILLRVTPDSNNRILRASDHVDETGNHVNELKVQFLSMHT